MKCGLIVPNCYTCTNTLCTLCKATYILKHDKTACLTDCSLDSSHSFCNIIYFNNLFFACYFLKINDILINKGTWYDIPNF